MITSENNWPRYEVTCYGCKKIFDFMSNKKPGDIIEVICECHEIHRLKLQPSDDKYRYSTQPATKLLRHEILHTIAEIKMDMTVRQVYYQLVVKGAVVKTDAGYDKVQMEEAVHKNDLSNMLGLA